MFTCFLQSCLTDRIRSENLSLTPKGNLLWPDGKKRLHFLGYNSTVFVGHKQQYSSLDHPYIATYGGSIMLCDCFSFQLELGILNTSQCLDATTRSQRESENVRKSPLKQLNFILSYSDTH